MNKTLNEKPSRWLITGGCGFIGTRLVRHLIQKGGCVIRVLDNLSVGTREDLAQVCEFVEIGEPPQLNQRYAVELIVGDLRDQSICGHVCHDVDFVVHLAANASVPMSVTDPIMDMEVNVAGTLNMLEASRRQGVKRFVFASSVAPIGECMPPVHEELAPNPVSPYGASKLAGEGYCSAYCRSFGLETVALRFSNVYGPGSGHHISVVAKFIRQAFEGETLEIYGDGYQTRDFIYVDDLVRAICLAAEVPDIGGHIFQIASNAETTVKELVDMLLPILADSGCAQIRVRHGAVRIGDIQRNYSDTSKARKMLGWSPKIELADGLKRTVDWFLQKNPNRKFEKPNSI